MNKIIVERETFESKGKTYYTYFIKGQVRGKDVRVAVIPPDKGGYAVLDIVFGDAMEAELVARQNGQRICRQHLCRSDCRRRWRDLRVRYQALQKFGQNSSQYAFEITKKRR